MQLLQENESPGCVLPPPLHMCAPILLPLPGFMHFILLQDALQDRALGRGDSVGLQLVKFLIIRP